MDDRNPYSPNKIANHIQRIIDDKPIFAQWDITRKDKMIDEWEEWYFNEFHHSAPQNLRFHSTLIALNWLKTHNKPPFFMIETGTSRNETWNPNDGMSTVVFGAFCKYYDGQLISVDCNATNINRAKVLTSNWADVVNFVQSDSVAFLASLSKKIDFLYLDSMDYEWHIGDLAERSQEHCLKEIQMAYPYLHKTSVVLIDDFWLPKGGKGTLARQFLLNRGWVELYRYQQGVYVSCASI
tara:strand:+ start:5786 stop:6502 length:717 start_codon:yes stop_codon:yes gene_type:complete